MTCWHSAKRIIVLPLHSHNNTNIMKISEFANNGFQPFEGTMAELIALRGLDSRYDMMFTLTTRPSDTSGWRYQFRAWVGPFANFSANHVDTGKTEKVFEILGKSTDEILEAVKPLIEHRAEWAPVGSNSVRLWLSCGR